MILKMWVFTILMLCISGIFADKKMVCYYGSWANYRNGNGKFSAQNLDPFMCTHLVYGFVGLQDDGSIRILDSWLDIDLGNFQKFNDLRKVNPALKTLVAIGGWNEGSARYSKMANDATLRAVFVKRAASFVAQYGFDGLDLDWEYPNQRDSIHKAADKDAFSVLLKELRQEFDKRNFLLTAAVAAVKSSASLSYLDFINIMTYDLHGSWDTKTGHNANLKQYEMSVKPADSFDATTAIDYWLSQGAPKEKLVMGMPLYGRTFSLQNLNSNGVGAAASGPGLAGKYTGESGMIGLNELCEKRLTESWPEIWDDTAQVPYTYKNRDWISYENDRSLQLKASFAMSRDLAGAMVWSIETDDFNGICNRGKYPYLRIINKQIGRNVTDVPPASSTTSSTSSSTSTSSSSTSSSTSTSSSSSPPAPTSPPSSSVKPSPGSPECLQEGFFRNPNNCNAFYRCILISDGVFSMYPFNCPAGLYFDTLTNTCNWPYLVNCK